jgi:hypothetical protein
MSAQGTIEIAREKAYVDKARAHKVLIDGTEVGRIKEGETQSFPVAPGAHEVVLKIDWATSPAVTVDVAPGSTAKLRTRPNGNPLTAIFYALFARKKYLTLEAV